MHKTSWFRILIILILPFSLVACATASEENTVPNEDEILLEIQGLEETTFLSLADLKAMPVTEGWGGTVSSAGVITPPQQLKGVHISALTDLVGGLEPGTGVSIVAKDGYAMTMSYEQIENGDFITYDPGTGDENQVAGPLQVILAYERDGEAILPEEDGPLRLFIVTPENDNVVDGHWAIKWVKQIRVKPMSEEWSLHLEGAITEEMDHNSFESCSASGCHQAAWIDEDGNEWSGVPLYYLAGRVDDGVIHEDRAYNDDFAQAGYVIELFAADGYNVSIDSSQADFNRDIFLAAMLNGEPLGEENFPLRLVGAELEKSQMAGQIAQIILNPNEGVAMPSAEVDTEPEELILPEGAALVIAGDVVNKLTLKLENLQAMQMTEVEVEHPKQGSQTYAGILLNNLLALAGPDSTARTLAITASDGFTAEVDLEAVTGCAECMLAITDDGSLSMVMPDLESGAWVKDVNILEVK